MTPTRTTLHFTLVALLLAATGCAGTSKARYQCPFTGGVSCMGATDVYAATEGEDWDHLGHPEGNVNARSTTPQSDVWAGETVLAEDGSLALTDSVGVTPVTSSAQATADSPLLTPAEVLRVWVAPWEDEGGNLHMAGYVFSEISKRKWRVGNAAPTSSPVLRLLDAPSGAGSSPSSNDTQPNL